MQASPHPLRISKDLTQNPGRFNLYAALDIASGNVITKMTDQHRAIEFRAFLNLIDKTVPTDLAVHVICDNASTHKAPEIQRWLKRHRRFTMHPFVWRQRADEILDNLASYLQRINDSRH